ncbi:hypothetical protein DBB34_03385 [Sphaerisporangium cinnabarinum]|nr:hypothetical protein [Sphaerisporangium cinnabarinum]PTU57589.1 hypothetical protein DBB34_03385 [Sphaerisporangium cinnabarinum]
MSPEPLTATVEHVLSEPRPDTAVTVTADLGHGHVSITFAEDVVPDGISRNAVAANLVADAAALVRRALDGHARA